MLCALLTTLCWACNFPVSRFLFGKGAEQLDEWAASYLRMIFALIFLLPFTFRKGEYKKLWENKKRDGLYFLLLSFLTMGEAVLAFIALKYTTAARASLMANTSPVFTLIISYFAGREILTGRKILGMSLGFSGLLLASFSRGSDVYSAGYVSTLTGDLIAIISGIFWSFYTVFGEKVASRYNGLFCSVIFKIISLFLMIPILICFDSSFQLKLPLSVWMGLLYLGICSSGLALALWSFAQKHVEPGALGAFGYISATCATVFSMIFLKEKLTLTFVLSFFLVLCGVFLMIRKEKTS